MNYEEASSAKVAKMPKQRVNDKEVLPVFDLGEQLYIEPSATCEGFYTTIFGVRVGEWLSLRNPYPNSWLYSLHRGDRIWVWCHRETRCRFKSIVLGFKNEPTLLIYIRYPLSLRKIDQRDGERYKTQTRCKVQFQQGLGEAFCWHRDIVNISESGCSVSGDLFNLVDRDISLFFTISTTGESFEVKAEVVRCEITEGGIQSGLRFLDLAPEAKNRLREFIRSLRG